MKKGITVFIVFFITLNAIGQDTTCIFKLGQYYNLDVKMLRIWHSDTSGCQKKRGGYARDLQQNKSLINMPQKLFFLFFGHPDMSTNEGVCIYYLHSDCDLVRKKLPNGDGMNLIVLFEDGALKSINIQIFD